MPLTENGAIKKVARSFAQLATPGSTKQQAFLSVVRKELKPEIRKMYATSSDPFGSAWTRNKDGSPAYDSKTMANAIGVARIPNGLAVREWVKWIKAADEGHTWPARHADHLVAYDKKGRQIKVYRRQKRGTYGPKALGKRVALIANADHTVGVRVLPPRPQQPNGVMPQAWGEAINRGSEMAIREFGERAFDDG